MTKWMARNALWASGLCLALGCTDDEDKSKDGGSDPDAGSEADAGGDAQDASDGEADAGKSQLSFFVTSDTSATGDLGGIPGADARCQRLAEAAGAGDHTWRAYLSAENNGSPIHARDRIGDGPWYNALGVQVAADVDALHAKDGDAELFVNEKGEKINGQWEGSPTPNEHDILTGSDATGRVAAGKTCSDWTSSASGQTALVGHSDGLGPGRNGMPPYNSWQSVHDNRGCNDTAPAGGAGKIYCFAVD